VAQTARSVASVPYVPTHSAHREWEPARVTSAQRDRRSRPATLFDDYAAEAYARPDMTIEKTMTARDLKLTSDAVTPSNKPGMRSTNRATRFP
jgi:hypothetical protein